MMDNGKQEHQGSLKEKIERSAKHRPRKALPTDRATFSKQLDVLRAAAAASGPDRKPLSNEEIAKVVNIHFGTVSNCNPFFLESGLMTRNKMQNIPCDEVFAYADRYKWDQDKAGHKLAPVIKKTWFCSTLVPKLNYREMSIDEAVGFLADEAGATPEYKAQLVMLIEYMRVSGIVTVDNNIVSLVHGAEHTNADTQEQRSNVQQHNTNQQKPPVKPNVEDTLHPFITGLLKTLPAPETDWPVSGRIKWLQAASNIFSLMYATAETNPPEIIISESKNGKAAI